MSQSKLEVLTPSHLEGQHEIYMVADASGSTTVKKLHDGAAKSFVILSGLKPVSSSGPSCLSDSI